MIHYTHADSQYCYSLINVIQMTRLQTSILSVAIGPSAAGLLKLTAILYVVCSLSGVVYII